MKRVGLWALAAAVIAAGSMAANGEVRFKKITVEKTFRSEGVAVGDINHDGKNDIFAGDVWFEAPDWKVHEIRKVETYKAAGGYSRCFANFAQDVNGDGWVDSIVIGMPAGPCLWYENPQNKPGPWKERVVAKSACNETPVFVDLLGAGKPVPLFGMRPEGVMAWFAIPKDLEGLWDAHPVSGKDAPATQQFSHGLGAGDVNGDGRADILTKDGWWEAPEDRTQPNWKWHPAKLGADCATMYAFDIDGDGLNDVLSSSAHNYGIWWHRQTKGAGGEPEFAQQEIFKEFSQPHAIELADVNGDGLTDFVTGKRWYAHNGGDPGGKDPAVLYWFELKRPEKGKAEFVPHKIDDDSGVGTQFTVTDFDGDKKPDIVISNKKGVYVFVQEK